MADIKLDATANVGKLAAETDDEFLFECFVDHPAYGELVDRNSPKMIALGSTGVGKTAILRMIQRQQEACKEVEIEELSLSYLTNSDVIRFLYELDVPTEQFFQALWKHIICLEYIKLRYKINDREKSLRFFDKLKTKFVSDAAKQKALKYLEKWDSKFWVSFDESAKEITKGLEQAIEAQAGGELAKFKANAKYVSSLSQADKIHLQQRLKKFVEAELLSDLAHVIRLLSEYGVDRQNTRYVLIDRLDENWVSSDLKFNLIRALIEALKGMRRISDLKVVVSLRSDLMEKIIDDTKDRGFQSEKYEDYIARVSWSKDELKRLLNNRVNFLFRRKYTKENVFLEDLFPDKLHKETPIDFICQRTLLRPRDAIIFLNMCLANGTGKNQVSLSAAREAERTFSSNRFSALVDEWRSVFPAVEPSLRILEQKTASFKIAELCTSDLQEKLIQSLFEKTVYLNDPLMQRLEKSMEMGSHIEPYDLAVELVERLNLIGAIGINVAPEEPIHWFYKRHKKVDRSRISKDSKIRIHPMLHSALAIK